MAFRKEKSRCSFCGRSRNQVLSLFSGPKNVFICNECVDYCQETMMEEMAQQEDFEYFPEAVQQSADTDSGERPEINLLKPRELKSFLDEYVIGQEEAKRVLSVAVYNHYKRILSGDDTDVELQKSNVLLLGPTGSGKTLLAQTLARILGVPFAIADATTLTEAGYVGEDVENILLKIIQAADYDISKASYGIIYIDEIDKITKKTENVSITRDVSGEGVQQALLKILEGTVASVPPQGGRKHPMQELLTIDTTNILFICGGAFDGLDKIIETRMDTKRIGFNVEVSDSANKDKKTGELFKHAVPQDFIKFGLIPEFIGRVPINVALEDLDEDALIRILTEPKNALVKQYTSLMAMDGVELTFEREALEEVAKKAMERKTGARGLRAILENVLMDDMYEMPSMEEPSRLVITREKVDENLILAEHLKEGDIIPVKGSVISIEERASVKESA